MASPHVGNQLANVLLDPPDIIVWIRRESAEAPLSRPGRCSRALRFDGTGREANETGDRSDGRPANWDKMTALDKRLWRI